MQDFNQKFLFVISTIIVILVPLISNTVPSQGLYFVEIAALALLFFWVKEISRQGRPTLVTTHLDRPLLALYLCGVISLFFTNYKYFGFERLKELFFYLIIYFATVNLLNSEKRLRQFIWLISIGCFGVSAYGLAQHFDITFTGWEVQPWGEAFGRRIFGSLGNPNWLCSYLVLCFPLVMGLFLFSPSKKSRNFLLLVMAISFSCLLLTKSLSGWISFAFLFFFFFYFLKKANLLHQHRRSAALASLVLIFVILIFSMNENPDFGKNKGPMYERLLRYRASLEMIKDYPLFGVGMGNAPVFADVYVAKFIEQQRYEILWPKEQSLKPLTRDRAENEYLDIGSETGLLGLACFVWLIIAIFKAHLKRMNEMRDEASKILLAGTYSALAASLIDSLLGFPLHVVPTAVLFFIVLGINSSLVEKKSYFVLPQFVAKDRMKLIWAVSILAVFSFFVLGKQFAAEVYLAKGRQLKNLNRHEDAVTFYTQAKTWDALNPQIDFELGMSLRVLEDYDGVIKHLERYSTIRPYHVLALYNLGFAYYATRNYDLAIQQYKKALELKPMFSYLWQQLGEAYLAKGENNLANQAFNNALKYAPENVDASIGLRRTGSTERKVEETVEEREISMHFSKAQRYIDQMELDLAAAEYKKILKLNPRNSDALSNSAVVYLWKGMAKRAEVCLRQAVEVDPQNILAKENLKTVMSGMTIEQIQQDIGRDFVDVPILMYHKIEDELHTQYWVETKEFEKQMEILDKYGYNTVTLRDLYDLRLKNTSLPKKPVVITFDDGFENFYTKAYPILKAHNFISTLFIIPDALGKADRAYEETANEPISKFMDKETILRLAKEGVVFGSHSYSHANLIQTDPEKWDGEIAGSKKYLEEELGLKIDFFCYPYGYLNPQLESEVREAGYLGAVIAKGGIEEVNYADFYSLRRILVSGGKEDPDSTFDFLKRVDPTCAIPEIDILSVKALSPDKKEPVDALGPGQKVLIEIKAKNSGDSADVSVGLRLKVKDGKKENIIYPLAKKKKGKADETESIEYLPAENFAFDSTKTFEFPTEIPTKIQEGEVFADIVFKDKHLLLDYFSQSDADVLKQATGARGHKETSPEN